MVDCPFRRPMSPLIMKLKEVRSEIHARLARRQSRSEVFDAMAGRGVKDARLALLIASYADPQLRAQHAALVKWMVAIAWVQLVFGVFASFALGLALPLIGFLLLISVSAAVGYLFVWGFRTDKAWAYNATILLSIINAPKTLSSVASQPLLSVGAFVLVISMAFFAWHVRSKLFPDFAFVGPRKHKGRYVFSS